MSAVYLNAQAKAWRSSRKTDQTNILKFHQSLPGYEPSPLIPLDHIAQQLGVKRVLLKYEGDRLGLKAFKVLGASWAVVQAISKRLGLHGDAHLEYVAAAARSKDITVATASQGNHGMAVAKMCELLGVKARIYIPGDGSSDVESNLESLGAEVVRCMNKDYDSAVLQACEESKQQDSILVQDTSWDGYEEIPAWIVDGYSTILTEIDEALGGNNVDLIVTPVGVGSLAHAIIRHYKQPMQSNTQVLTVESEGAACLYSSLTQGHLVSVKTQSSILAGMNCGTVSLTAWEDLRQGVDASTTITDLEAEKSLLYLKDRDVEAGPCGAAALAGLLRVSSDLNLNGQSIVVLVCSEGPRKY